MRQGLKPDQRFPLLPKWPAGIEKQPLPLGQGVGARSQIVCSVRGSLYLSDISTIKDSDSVSIIESRVSSQSLPKSERH